MNKAVPATNNAVLKSMILLHKDACQYAGAGILRKAYMESIVRRSLGQRLPRK